jgi:hypothetical protein
MNKVLQQVVALTVAFDLTGCNSQGINEPSTPTVSSEEQNLSGGEPVTLIDQPALASAPEDAEAAISSFQSQALRALPQGMAADARRVVTQFINDRPHIGARRTTWDACFSGESTAH